MFSRDPKDRSYRKRLAASYLGSLILHLLSAALLISVAPNASQSGASEDVTVAQLVTTDTRVPALTRAPVSAQKAALAPSAPHAALVHHPRQARPAHQRLVPAPPELSNIVPSAPPISTPVPQKSEQPQIAPTAAAYEIEPERELPALPTAIPAQVDAIALKIPPTAAPSPAPSVAPKAVATAAPTGIPSVAPVTLKPATPRTVASAAPVAAASPAPGASASPGPAEHSSPGPRAGSVASAKPQPPRPISVPPTPAPRKTSHPAIDINARLRAMLPNNPVAPSFKTYRQNISLNGRLEPTPPPEVLAQTRFIFEENGVGGDARIKMWVTAIRHVGPITYCDGWLLRFPRADNSGAFHIFGTRNVEPNAVQAGGNPGGTLAPIVETGASAMCSERALVPFAASPAPSP